MYTFSLGFKIIYDLKQKELAIWNHTSMRHVDLIREVVENLLNKYGEKIFVIKYMKLFCSKSNINGLFR